MLVLKEAVEWKAEQGTMKVEGLIMSWKEVLRGVACFMVIDLLD